MKPIYLILLFFCLLAVPAQSRPRFSFALAADMRNFTGDKTEYFRGICESVGAHKDISFMISPGDIDPPDSVYYTIQKYLNANMLWYPVVGNHEAETASDMEWLRNYNKGGLLLPNIVNAGPASSRETNYSFDYKNTHFVILNQYSKENCDRFVKLLQDYKVKAYIYGHTHNYVVAKLNKLWHIDVGHSRGKGDPGARSTYLIMTVAGNQISYSTYRLNDKTNSYEIADNAILD